MSMKVLSGAARPKFDRKAPHGTVYGSGEESTTGRAAFCQNGHYFSGDGSYVGSDIDAKNVAMGDAVAPQVDQGSRQVSEAELEEFMKHDKAGALMSLPVPTLQAMVTRAGGPSYSGDNAHRYYVAWLLKFTQHDG